MIAVIDPSIIKPLNCIARGHKKPITFFKTSRGRRPWCHGVSDLCCNWFVARLNMD